MAKKPPAVTGEHVKIRRPHSALPGRHRWYANDPVLRDRLGRPSGATTLWHRFTCDLLACPAEALVASSDLTGLVESVHPTVEVAA